MNHDPAPSQSGDSLLARIVADYLAAADAGQAPSRQELLARYPDVAGALGLALDGLDALHAAVRPGLSCAPSPARGETPAGPQPVGDFRILREIGRGGMGVVYEAEQLSLARRVALKVLPFAAALDPRHLRRFQTEAQAAAGLHHPHVVPVYAVGTDRGVHYYAMQLIEGQSLAAVIAEIRNSKSETRNKSQSPIDNLETEQRAREDTRPELGISGLEFVSDFEVRISDFFRRVAQLGVQAAEALAYAHDLDVIHRDVKPANLLLNAHGHVWLTDFGLARLGSATGLTHTGEMLGTPRYMSPEQAAGHSEQVTHRTDIYSLGATLYELLARVPAFPQTEREDVLRRIATEEPPPPRRHDPRIPNDLETIVLKAMAKMPAERYATAQDLADDLQRFLDNRPVLARRPGIPHRVKKWARRHRTALAILAAGAVLGLAASQTWTWQAYRAESAARRESERKRAELVFTAVSRIGSGAETVYLYAKQLSPADRAKLHQSLTEAVELLDTLYEEDPTDPEIRRRLGVAYKQLGAIRVRSGEHRDQGVALYRRALRLFEGLAAEFPQEPAHRYSVFFMLNVLGTGLSTYEEQEANSHRALQVLLALHREAPANRVYREALATQYNVLGDQLRDTERSSAAAEDYHRQAVALIRALLPEDPRPSHLKNLAVGLRGLGSLRAEEGQDAEALGHVREARQTAEFMVHALPPLPEYRWLLSSVWHEEGLLLHRLRRYEEAAQALEQALIGFREYVRDYSPAPDQRYHAVPVLLAQARLFHATGRVAERDAKQREALESLRSLERELPGYAMAFREHIGILLDPPDERPDLDQALRVAQELKDPLWLGLVHARRREWGAAISQLEQLPAGYEPKRTWGRMLLALCDWNQGDRERARRLYNEVTALVKERGIRRWNGERYQHELERLMGVRKE